MAIHRIPDLKSSIDPAIPAIAILDPDQNVWHAVEKRSQLKYLLELPHDGILGCHELGGMQLVRNNVSRSPTLYLIGG
jgi:hypothetical protein